MSQKTLGIVLTAVIVVGAGVYIFWNWQTQPLPTPTSLQIEEVPIKEPATDINFCSSINGSLFRSVRKLEIGLGPDGPVMGYWTIRFKDGSVSWHHSDTVESGSYICKENRITVKFFNRSIQSSYDNKKNILVWEEEEYLKSDIASQACPTSRYSSPYCPKIPTKAKNLNTGEIKEFPNACLPECWVEL